MFGLILTVAMVGQISGAPQWGWWKIDDHGLQYNVWGRKVPDGSIEYWPIKENLDAKQAATTPKATEPTHKAAVEIDPTLLTGGVDPTRLGNKPIYHADSPAAQKFVEGIHDTQAVIRQAPRYGHRKPI